MKEGKRVLCDFCSSIASAPELYEACRELLLASEMPYGSSEYPDAVDKARAAIAKAEGRLEP